MELFTYFLCLHFCFVSYLKKSTSWEVVFLSGGSVASLWLLWCASGWRRLALPLPRSTLWRRRWRGWSVTGKISALRWSPTETLWALLTHSSMHGHAQAHACIFMYTQTKYTHTQCMHTCTHMHAHTQCTCVHTHTHTHTNPTQRRREGKKGGEGVSKKKKKGWIIDHSDHTVFRMLQASPGTTWACSSVSRSAPVSTDSRTQAISPASPPSTPACPVPTWVAVA